MPSVTTSNKRNSTYFLTICTTSSSISACSLPTRCGLCFTELPHTSALTNNNNNNKHASAIMRHPLRNNLHFELAQNRSMDRITKVFNGASAIGHHHRLSIIGQLSFRLGVAVTRTRSSCQPGHLSYIHIHACVVLTCEQDSSIPMIVPRVRRNSTRGARKSEWHVESCR